MRYFVPFEVLKNKAKLEILVHTVWTTEFDLGGFHLKRGNPMGGFHLKKEETPTISLENPDKRWKPLGGFQPHKLSGPYGTTA